MLRLRSALNDGVAAARAGAAGCVEKLADVLDAASAGLGEVAMEGRQAGFEEGKIRVRACAEGIEPA